MELTIRTPYKTLCSKLTDFQRIITKTNEAVLVISNKMPAALHILPPGSLMVRTGSQIPGFSGDFLHTGGWLAIHPDNSCEINLVECADRASV